MTNHDETDSTQSFEEKGIYNSENTVNILIATVKNWNIRNSYKIKEKNKKYNWHLITDNKQLTYDGVAKIDPKYVFFPHWSWKVPGEVYKNFECIAFHMADLPFGRGGSPLQNLIERGIYATQISALRMVDELDAGPIYMKKPLSLCGSAEEIFMLASEIVFDMMIEIIENNPTPKPQEGNPVVFKRRSPEESEIPKESDLRRVFDYIRMLDAEGYPNAYVDWSNLKMEFTRASLKDDFIIAEVRITTKRMNRK